MTKWKFVGFGTECGHCGGSENVQRYKHEGTGEEQAICDPCEQAAAGFRQ